MSLERRIYQYKMDKEKVIELIGEDWAQIIENEFYKEYMENLGKYIASRRRETTVYPETSNKVFSVFRNLPPHKIKVVIIGQDPYHDGSYDGRAFSNSGKNMKMSPSLNNIIKEIENDIYNGLLLDKDPSLERLENQGVFLLNRVLTVEKGKPNSHKGLGWEEFTARVIEELSSNYKNLVFMLWGNSSKTIEKYIKANDHLILKSGHPSPMSANQGLWFGNKHFSLANKYLASKGINEIKW